MNKYTARNYKLSLNNIPPMSSPYKVNKMFFNNSFKKKILKIDHKYCYCKQTVFLSYLLMSLYVLRFLFLFLVFVFLFLGCFGFFGGRVGATS